MDDNTKLIIGSTQRPENWEDREKATDEVATLREEFRNRLYPQQVGQGGRDSQSKTSEQ